MFCSPTGSHTVRRNDYENIFANKKTVDTLQLSSSIPNSLVKENAARRIEIMNTDGDGSS
jgi:hypothetical protein